MALEIISTGGGNATADSIVIPQTDLAGYGVTAAEMTNDATGLARAIWGFVKAVQDFDDSSALGFALPANPSFSLVPGNYTNRTYTVTVQKYVDFTDGNNGVVPLPVSGANSGVGGFSLVDIFPNSSKVSAAGAVAAEALLIASADLTSIISTITHASITIAGGEDHREVMGAIYEMFNEQLTLRDGSTASAFVATSRGTLGLTATVPAAYIDATDPTSGLSPANVAGGNVGLLNKTSSLTIQTEEDLTNDTVDVRVATT